MATDISRSPGDVACQGKSYSPRSSDRTDHHAGKEPRQSPCIGLLIMIIRICRYKLSQYPLSTHHSVVTNPCAMSLSSKVSAAALIVLHKPHVTMPNNFRSVRVLPPIDTLHDFAYIRL